jgi:hypothetical protein
MTLQRIDDPDTLHNTGHFLPPRRNGVIRNDKFIEIYGRLIILRYDDLREDYTNWSGKPYEK